MTSRCILIKGARIDIDKYHKWYDKELPEWAEDFEVLGNEPIFVVSREYDSNDWDDHGFYHMVAYYNFYDNPDNIICEKKLQEFLSTKVDMEELPFYEKIGTFIDYYDMDEGFEERK